MLKRVVIIIFTLLLATVIGVTIAHDPGYVLFSYGLWTMEMPLWVFVLLFIVMVVVSFGLLKSLALILNSRQTWQRWRARRRLEQAMIALEVGLLALAEENLPAAERAFRRAAKQDARAGSGYLLLSQLALSMNLPALAKQYYQTAAQFQPKAEVALGLTRAQWLAREQREDAIAELHVLRMRHPKQRSILQSLWDLYDEQQDWSALLGLLPLAQKNRLFSRDEICDRQRQMTLKVMSQYRDTANWQGVLELWDTLPRQYWYDAEVVSFVSGALSATGKSARAEKLVKKSLRKHYHPQLVIAYSQLANIDKTKQITQIEKWVPEHPEDPDLLYALGKLCSDCRLWGKAKDYLERAMAVRCDNDTSDALGNVLEHLKDSRAAIDVYRQGLHH